MEGYQFTGWSGYCTGQTSCVIRGDKLTEDVTVTANYEKVETPTYTLNATQPTTESGTASGTISISGGGLDCGKTCSVTTTSDQVSLTATPISKDYTFKAWTGDCATQTSANCTLDLNDGKTVHTVGATFTHTEPVRYVLSYNASGNRINISVSADSNPKDVTCSSDLDGYTCKSFPEGSRVTLQATPSSYFDWTGDCLGTSLNCTLVMEGDRRVTGRFINSAFHGNVSRAATAGKDVFVTSVFPANIPLGGSLNAQAGTTDAFELMQLTPDGWQPIVDGQLIPYPGITDNPALTDILGNANPSDLNGAQFCVGSGSDAADMVIYGRMRTIGSIGVSASNLSCNVASSPYKGLWFNPGESGWGMSIAQHNDINFVTIYTYDTDGLPLWYVMSDCRISTPGQCTGKIYRVVGGMEPTSDWDGSGIAVTESGSGTITFSDGNKAVFDFTLNGVSGVKAIQRQRFANGTPAQLNDYTDLWWNAKESGWGISLTQDAGMLLAGWYTYDANKNPMWYVVSNCALSNAACSGDLYQVSGGNAPTAIWSATPTVTPVGSASLSFRDAGHGTLTYTVNGQTDTRPITRQSF